MRSRKAAYLVYPAATVLGVSLAWLVYRDAPDERARAGDDGLPRRCAALAENPSEDQLLHLASTGQALTIGVVADARGADDATLDRVGRAGRAFAEAGVDLVLSLGGMGGDADELAAVYGALAGAGDAPVVAIPGDREPLLAHREAIAKLASTHPLHDGSAIRIIRASSTTVATFPGVAEPSQLLPGEGGCYFEPADAEAMAAFVARREGVVVWAGYAPPRQQGDAASDLVRGVHIGDRTLATAMRTASVELALHGLVDEAALEPREGVRRLDTGQTFALAPGPVEALPVLGERRGVSAGAALLVTLDPPRVEWRRIDPAPDEATKPEAVGER
jgi:hypothetical protein